MPAQATCPHCSHPIAIGSRFCASCGQPASSPSALPTEQFDPGTARSSRRASPLHSSTPKPRFLPGTILAERYRIVGLLGKGGMGEVYRADDLKLGQAVALKFLPPGFESNPERLERFLDEVRTARQVSHSNVCRIYDAGEADGHHFLSMEYVDGEDLASLLRRIGHLPKEKAIQIARQLCAGLAASHEIGVLHRDLKPANIMIDGRGRARITDFGLAALAGNVEGAEILSGTPAYMAPEQLAGREVTVRSDLYSLGLVLYELFTGKPAFQAASRDELRRLQSETTPSSPSTFVEGFDPMVERVILRCLDADPARRPASALAVAAALPGGDPIAAALAAGETPSPQMVAEAGDKGAVVPALAWSALALFGVSLAAFLALTPMTSLIAMVPLEKPPEFLQERARELLALAGYDQKPADSLFEFESNGAYLDDILHGRLDPAIAGTPEAGKLGTGTRRWEVLRSPPPSGIRFWYRQSPYTLERTSLPSLGGWTFDPPTLAPGMARVGLDPEGRLTSLMVVPGDRTDPAVTPAEPDWEPLLRATGLDMKSMTPVPPEWVSPFYSDHRAAWIASWPGQPTQKVRVEVSAAGGKAASLRLVRAEDHGGKDTPAGAPSILSQMGQALNAAWGVVVIVLAGFFALRNVRRGRGDRRGALRLALYLGAVRMLWFLGAHHALTAYEYNLFLAHLSYALQRVGLAYVFYLAIEPYARRLWPHMLTSWVRVLEGRFRDPLVGRDLLVGSAAGAAGAFLARLAALTPALLGGPSMHPQVNQWTMESLRGPVGTVVSVLGIHTTELLGLIFPVTMLLIFRLLFRRNVPAIIAVSILGGLQFAPQSESILGALLGILCLMLIGWTVLFRFGLLGLAAMTTVSQLIDGMPLTLHPEGWYLGSMLLALLFIAAPAAWGFWYSQGGRPLFRDELLEAPARH